MSLVRQTVFIANKEKENELKKLLFTLLFNIKKTPGCMNFEVYEADEDNSEFLVYEEWTDQEAFDAYKQSENYKTLVELKKPLVKREEILPNF